MLTTAPLETLHERLAAVKSLTSRTNKAAVLVVQQFPVADDTGVLFPHVRESIANVLAFVELGTADDLASVFEVARDAFNWIVVDCDHKLPGSPEIVRRAHELIPREQLLFFSDNQVWFDSGLDIVQRLEHGLSGKRVMIRGTGPLADAFAEVLPRVGAVAVRADAAQTIDPYPAIVLGCAQKRQSIDEAVVERVPVPGAIYDIGLGNLSLAAADRARDRGLALYRLDNRAGVSSAIIRLLETDYLVGRLMGHLRLKGVDIFAAGLLAPSGAVIVDDIRNPSHIFGVADGKGRFREPLEPEDAERVAFVRSLLRTSS